MALRSNNQFSGIKPISNIQTSVGIQPKSGIDKHKIWAIIGVLLTFLIIFGMGAYLFISLQSQEKAVAGQAVQTFTRDLPPHTKPVIWGNCIQLDDGINITYTYEEFSGGVVHDNYCISGRLINYSCTETSYSFESTICPGGCNLLADACNYNVDSAIDSVVTKFDTVLVDLGGISVATAYLDFPECSDSTDLPTIMRNYFYEFLADNSDGVYMYMLQFQRKINCINTADMRKVDNALAQTIEFVKTNKDGNMKKSLLNAHFNPSVAVFDQLMYTGESNIYDVFTDSEADFQESLESYPAENFWLMDMDTLLFSNPRRTCQECQERIPLDLFNAFQEPRTFGTGTCGSAEMVGNNMFCNHGIDCQDDLIGGNPRVSQYAGLNSGTSQEDIASGTAEFNDLTTSMNPFDEPYESIAQDGCGGADADSSPFDNNAAGDLGAASVCSTFSTAIRGLTSEFPGQDFFSCYGQFGQGSITESRMTSCGQGMISNDNGLPEGDYMPDGELDSDYETTETTEETETGTTTTKKYMYGDSDYDGNYVQGTVIESTTVYSDTGVTTYHFDVSEQAYAYQNGVLVEFGAPIKVIMTIVIGGDRKKISNSATITEGDDKESYTAGENVNELVSSTGEVIFGYDKDLIKRILYFSVWRSTGSCIDSFCEGCNAMSDRARAVQNCFIDVVDGRSIHDASRYPDGYDGNLDPVIHTIEAEGRMDRFNSCTNTPPNNQQCWLQQGDGGICQGSSWSVAGSIPDLSFTHNPQFDLVIRWLDDPLTPEDGGGEPLPPPS